MQAKNLKGGKNKYNNLIKRKKKKRKTTYNKTKMRTRIQIGKKWSVRVRLVSESLTDSSVASTIILSRIHCLR